eukprot:TRINITY_DN56083_c0_g1_i1.p1 TRINITY_DN56083_c0_g1~~TRINITY_DN56083_c0_g1_i1.p1  ORF type:complete len:524 (+),score=105.39 TRINITY_DN56083_c0_g1_i1:111-1574(+)
MTSRRGAATAILLAVLAHPPGAVSPAPGPVQMLQFNLISTGANVGLTLDDNMFVTDVKAGSSAMAASLQVGMLLVSIDSIGYIDSETALKELNTKGVYTVGVTMGCLRYVDQPPPKCNGAAHCRWSLSEGTCLPQSLFPATATLPVEPTPAPTPEPPPHPTPAPPPTPIPAGSEQEPRQVIVSRPGANDDLGVTLDSALVVTGVIPGGLAEGAGIKPGMRMIAVNGRLVNTPVDVTSALDVAGLEVQLTVLPHCSALLNQMLCAASGPTSRFAPGCRWDSAAAVCVGLPPAAVSVTPQPPSLFDSSGGGGLGIGGLIGVIVGGLVCLCGSAAVGGWLYYRSRSEYGELEHGVRSGLDDDDDDELHEGSGRDRHAEYDYGNRAAQSARSVHHEAGSGGMEVGEAHLDHELSPDVGGEREEAVSGADFAGDDTFDDPEPDVGGSGGGTPRNPAADPATEAAIAAALQGPHGVADGHAPSAGQWRRGSTG